MRFTSFKAVPLLLVLVLAFLQYHLWFESGGIIDMIRTKKELALQMKENDKLKKRNDDVMQEVHQLQTSKDAIESRARDELGMVKKDETYYQVVQ